MRWPDGEPHIRLNRPIPPTGPRSGPSLRVMLERRRPVGEKRILATGLVLVVVVLAVAAGLIRASREEARRDLDDRFLTRTELTASFTRDFVDDLAAREASQGARLLGGASVDQATFDQVVGSFDFDAAVLLEGDGRVVHAYPAAPELEGRDLAADYEHLRVGTTGEIGVSRLVPSAVEHIPITAVAAPFESAVGRRA